MHVCVCVLGKCVSWTGLCGTRRSRKPAQRSVCSASSRTCWREPREPRRSCRTSTMMSLPLTDTWQEAEHQGTRYRVRYWTEAAQLYLILHQSCFSLKSDHQDLLRSVCFQKLYFHCSSAEEWSSSHIFWGAFIIHLSISIALYVWIISVSSY